MTEATKTDIQDGFHSVKYLKGTPNLGLTFANNTEPILEAFIDASHLLHWDSKDDSGLSRPRAHENCVIRCIIESIS
jgi:hypothetical protein